MKPKQGRILVNAAKPCLQYYCLGEYLQYLAFMVPADYGGHTVIPNAIIDTASKVQMEIYYLVYIWMFE